MSALNTTVANPFADLDLDRLRTRTCAKWGYYPEDVLPLWVAEMDAYVAPEITAAVTAAMENGDTGYPFGSAYPDAVASFAAERWNWSMEGIRTGLVADVLSGVREVLAEISPVGSALVLTPPVYPPFFGIAGKMGREVISAPLTTDGRMDAAALEAAFQEATANGRVGTMLMSNPHNPTGTVHSRAELEMLANLARQYGVRVISDEIHAPLIMPTSTFTPYLSVANTGQDFAVVSASKGWNLAAFKAAMVMIGADAPEQMMLHGAGHIGVIAHTAAFNHARGWLDAAIGGIDSNRKLLADLLETHMPRAMYQMPESTYLAWIDLRDLGLGDDPAATILEKARVGLSSGTPFGTQGVGFVRFNMATSPAIMEEAVTRIAALTK